MIILLKNGGIHYININLPKIVNKNGFIVKFAGVFVHQKPLVEINICNSSCYIQNSRCERGDLLTLFLYIDKN